VVEREAARLGWRVRVLDRLVVQDEAVRRSA
jgi:hypothetical protein